MRKTGRRFNNKENDMQEIADPLNRHMTVGVAEKEMEAAKIDPATQNSLKG